MKNNQKRLFFKLDQARLKTIRDPAWACKHAQQSQYKLPATAFSLAFMNLEHPFTFSQMHNVLEWKGIKKVSSSKTAWRQKNVCSANARTKRRSESLLHLSSQVSGQIFNLFCFILVVLSSSAKKTIINERHHAFFFLQLKIITLFVVVQILVLTQYLTTCFSCELNSIAIGSKKIFLVSKC